MQEQNIHYQFHDYKTMGISAKQLKSWCDQAGWETIFNKRSATFKTLPVSVQESVTNASKAISLMVEHTSIIKRPVITKGTEVILVGFDPKKYAAILEGI